MKNLEKMIANRGYREGSCVTTRSTDHHGLSRGARRYKVLVNRYAKRRAARLAIQEGMGEYEDTRRDRWCDTHALVILLANLRALCNMCSGSPYNISDGEVVRPNYKKMVLHYSPTPSPGETT